MFKINSTINDVIINASDKTSRNRAEKLCEGEYLVSKSTATFHLCVKRERPLKSRHVKFIWEANFLYILCACFLLNRTLSNECHVT